MKHFPSWRYHKTLEPKIVHSEEEDKALGKGWADTPAAFEGVKSEDPKPPKKKPETPSPSDDESETQDSEEGDSDSENESEDLSALTAAKLKELCVQKGIKPVGNKAALIELLKGK